MNPHSFPRAYNGQSTNLDRLMHPNGYSRPGVSSMDTFGDYSVGFGLNRDEVQDPGRSDGGRGRSHSQSQQQSQSQSQVFQSTGPTGKRGSRACVACRKGKNRCEPDPSGNGSSCRRCLLNGITCIFEKASDKRETRQKTEPSSSSWTGDAEGRVSSLEKSVQELASGQTQIQNALQQILSMMPTSAPSTATPSSAAGFMQHSDTTMAPVTNLFKSSTSPSAFSTSSPTNTRGPMAMSIDSGPRSPQNIASGRRSTINSETHASQTEWPKLPGFAPPDHRFGTYGILVASAPPSPGRSSRESSADTSSSAVPPSSMVAPIQALQTLANAADQAAALANVDAPTDTDASHSRPTSEEGFAANTIGGRDRRRKRKGVPMTSKNVHLRVKKLKKPDPTPRNPFPDVVTKGLVSETEARELWDIFFSGCHYFVPLWDKKYDVFETYVERTPFSTNGLLAVAAKIRAGNGPLGQTFHRCLEEAQGIARSTLFGPIVRKEAVMAMLILSVWSQYSWLPCGHALRMGLDMNLHRALDKLADPTNIDERSEAEERDLVVSARIWLNCFLHERLSSLGTGKPLVLRDESSVQSARVLLSHPMVSETDASLVARVELVNLRTKVLENLTPLHGKVTSDTIQFVRRILDDMQNWHTEWYDIHRTKYEDEDVQVRLLEVDLLYAQLWTVCVALRGCQWDRLDKEQKLLALQAKDAASRCIHVFLHARNFRLHLKYATHDQLATVAFAAVFLLKIAMLYPNTISLPTLTAQVTEVVQVLSNECFAERYALTLKLMVANFRRKTGALSTVPGTPRGNNGMSETMPDHPANGPAAVGELDGGLESLLSLPALGEGLNGVNNDAWSLIGDGMEGFAWPTEFSPSNLPTWLQDNSVTDLGLPVDGSDSLFLPLELANMFLPSGMASSANLHFTFPDSGDMGAEAW